MLSDVGSRVDISLVETWDLESISPTESSHYFHLYEDMLNTLC